MEAMMTMVKLKEQIIGMSSKRSGIATWLG
jgi:hypothetical protein